MSEAMDEVRGIIQAKPIAGFRSTLEARWAVVLQLLGVTFEYEPLAFRVSDGNRQVWYMPDFHLPRQKVWIEVKPDAPSAEEYAKAKGLLALTGERVFFYCGFPFKRINPIQGSRPGVIEVLAGDAVRVFRWQEDWYAHGESTTYLGMFPYVSSAAILRTMLQRSRVAVALHRRNR